MDEVWSKSETPGLLRPGGEHKMGVAKDAILPTNKKNARKSARPIGERDPKRRLGRLKISPEPAKFCPGKECSRMIQTGVNRVNWGKRKRSS